MDCVETASHVSCGRPERGDGCCCLVVSSGGRHQRRVRAHVPSAAAATSRSDRTWLDHRLRGQSRRCTEAGYLLPAVSAAASLSGRLAHSQGGSVPRQGERSWNSHSASSYSQSWALVSLSTG